MFIAATCFYPPKGSFSSKAVINDNKLHNGDGKEHENDEDDTDMNEDQDALITESEDLELGRLKEE